MVPVEEWKERNEKDKEIDLLKLANHIWDRRKFVYKVTGLLVIIGVLIALLSPVEYETEATLIPESQSAQNIAGNLLQEYGGILGIGGGNLDFSKQGTIPPQLYPRIVNSLPFQLQLLEEKVFFSSFDTTATVYAFFNDIYTPSVFSYIIKYTFGLRGVIKDLIYGEKMIGSLPEGFDQEEVLQVTENQMEAIEVMRERVIVNLDEESGIISITTEMPDPQASAIVGNKAINLLTKYLKEYQTQKAIYNLRFVRDQYGKAKKRFEKAQNALAEFRDQNLNLATAKALTQEQRLQAEYDLTFNLYNSLAQNMEQAQMEVQEQTPVFKTLQPVQIPLDKSKPQRTLIVLVFFALGIVLASVYLILRVI